MVLRDVGLTSSPNFRTNLENQWRSCFSIRKKKKSSIKYLPWPLLICFEEKCINQVAKLSGNISEEESSIELHSDQLEEHYLISLSQSSEGMKCLIYHRWTFQWSVLLKTSFFFSFYSQQYYYENKLTLWLLREILERFVKSYIS